MGGFERAAPLILGALLDAVAFGLKTLPDVKLDRKPRMADFAKWIVACEGGLPWKAGTFMRAYDGNRAEALEAILESDAAATAIRSLLTRQPDWEGTAAGLLKEVNAAAAEETPKAKEWPKTPRGMSGALRRAAPGLRKLGYTVGLDTRDTHKNRTRLICLAAPRQARAGTVRIVRTVQIPVRRRLEYGRSKRCARAIVRTTVRLGPLYK